MNIFPAIDILDGKAVRLYKGDYSQKVVYSSHPEEIALDFVKNGASFIHIVDLDGARDGTTINFDTIINIKKTSSLFCEVGGGIRTLDTITKYLSNGIDRVILGTAALEDENLLKTALKLYPSQIAIGVDIKDGFVSIKGWKETSSVKAFDFIERLVSLGVQTIICTDISRDGAMKGTNKELYKSLQETFNINIVASGGVSSLDDVKALKEMNLYGAIIGKAYYEKALSLSEAIEVSKNDN